MCVCLCVCLSDNTSLGNDCAPHSCFLYACLLLCILSLCVCVSESHRHIDSNFYFRMTGNTVCVGGVWGCVWGWLMNYSYSMDISQTELFNKTLQKWWFKAYFCFNFLELYVIYSLDLPASLNYLSLQNKHPAYK